MLFNCRSLGSYVFPCKSTQNEKEHSPWHCSSPEKRVEGFFWIQSNQLWKRLKANSPHDHRRERPWQLGKIWRPHPCHLDPPHSWILHFFWRGWQSKLLQVVQRTPTHNWPMGLHRNWSRTWAFQSRLLHHDRREKIVVSGKLETFRVWKCEGLLHQPLVFCCGRVHQKSGGWE